MDYDKIWELFKKASASQKSEIINKMSKEDLIELRQRANPYRKPIYNSKHKQLEVSILRLDEEYMQNFTMTALVGFIYKMATEFRYYENRESDLPSETEGTFATEMNKRLQNAAKTKLSDFYGLRFKESMTTESEARWLRALATTTADPEIDKIAHEFCRIHSLSYNSVYPKEVPLDAEDNERIRQAVKKDLGIQQTREDAESMIQDYILDFLDEYFCFDPNNHIRCGYMPQYDQILQEKLKCEKPQYVQTPKGNHMIVTDKFEEYLIPPADTFFAFKNYRDSNYEYLRQATNDIYGNLALVEAAIIPHEVFQNESQASSWRKTYHNDLNTDTILVDFNEWTFTGPWAKNRDKLTFQDEKSRLITDMIERAQKDRNLGRDLLNKKKKKMKGRTDSVPFESGVQEYIKEEKQKESDVECKVFSSKILRSKRLKTAFTHGSFGVKAEAPNSN